MIGTEVKSQFEFEVKATDLQFYRRHLEKFIPNSMIDIHAHVWLERFKSKDRAKQLRAVTWPRRVCLDNPIEHLVETCRLMFPGKTVTSLIFGNTGTIGDDIDAGDNYVSESARGHGFPSLVFAAPQWSELELETRITSGGFLGAKVYLTLSDPRIPESSIQIYDFLPPHQLKVLDAHGWVAMLHLPRRARLKDPLNLSQMIEIEREFPNVKLIIAHVGRAYCPQDIGDAFEILQNTRRMYFDTSANTCVETFEGAIRAVGPKRLLFGSDLPVTRMRMRRVCEGGTYVNLVPKGIYGDVSGDPHMREVDGKDAEELTFFMYEEDDAIRRAAEKTGLTTQDVQSIFYTNSAELLSAAGGESFIHRKGEEHGGNTKGGTAPLLS
jgi:hypothetical protein